jgi:hypothetical protein
MLRAVCEIPAINVGILRQSCRGEPKAIASRLHKRTKGLPVGLAPGGSTQPNSHSWRGLGRALGVREMCERKSAVK